MTGNPAFRAAAMESRMPVSPKSIPWLFAIDATSTPPASSAAKAVAGARNVYALDWGVPRFVIAVSRFTTVRSASPRTGRMERRTWRGSASSSWRIGLSKCTSPANASVTGFPLPSRGEAAGFATRETFRAASGFVWRSSAPTAEDDCRPPMTAASTTTTSAAPGTQKRSARTRRRVANASGLLTVHNRAGLE